MMAGSHLGQGNTRKYHFKISFVSEFNAFNDPHAFHILMKSFPSIIVLPFDSIF